MEFDIFVKGFIITFSLIVAIGAQNAYILKLGLLKQYVAISVIFCILSDLLLITLGVYGLGYFIKNNQFLINSVTIFGICFLFYYAFLSFKAALKNESMNVEDTKNSYSLRKILSMLFMFTYLNPHAYLDTILLIGGVGANVAYDMKPYFLLGAISGSTLWFTLLGYGARFLIPLFKKPITWKILDVSIGFIMLFIAYSLIDLISS